MKKHLILLFVILPLVTQAQVITNISSGHSTGIRSNFFEPADLNLRPALYDLPGSRKTRKGKAMMIIGAVFMAAGTSVLATSDGVVSAKFNESKGNGTYGAADLKAEAGTVLVAAGVALFVPGVIVYSKGKKINNASNVQTRLSLHPNGTGLKLCLKL